MLSVICKTTECWDATGSMMQGWAAVAGVGAVIYAARRAADTFAAYRRQKQEDRRIDAAERVLTLAYKLKRSIAAVRSPMSHGAEISRAQEALEGTDWYKVRPEHGKRKAETGVIIMHRLNDGKETWDEIFSTMPVARALFGEHVEAELQRFWGQIAKIKVSAEMYRTDDGHDPAFTKRMERDFWDHGKAAENPVSDNVDAAISTLERILLPVIRAEHEFSRPPLLERLAARVGRWRN